MSILERLQFQQRQRTVTPASGHSRGSIFDPDGPAIGSARPGPGQPAAARFVSLEDELQVRRPVSADSHLYSLIWRATQLQ